MPPAMDGEMQTFHYTLRFSTNRRELWYNMSICRAGRRLRGTEVINGAAIPSSVKVYSDDKTRGLAAR